MFVIVAMHFIFIFSKHVVARFIGDCVWTDGNIVPICWSRVAYSLIRINTFYISLTLSLSFNAKADKVLRFRGHNELFSQRHLTHIFAFQLILIVCEYVFAISVFVAS